MLIAFIFITEIIIFGNTMSKLNKFPVTCEEIIFTNNQMKSILI